MNESFDFNKVRDDKPSIAGVIKKTAITLIEENVLPLFNNLRPDYKERYKFIPEHRFIGNKCELLYQNKVIIDFTFGYDYIEEMNVYDTTRLTVVGYNGYIQDVSVIFYVVRQIPMPINTLNFCYDSSKYPAYKFEGDIAHDEMRDLTRIMEDYTDSLPEHITFNSKYIDLHNLRFENENAIKKFLYKIRKDNGEQKYEIKQCIFITETPPEFRGLLNTPRSKGTTSKLIRKYIKAPVNTLLEGFDFDSIDKKKILPSLSMKDKVLLFDNFLKDLYDKHVLTGMQYGNKYFSDAWSKAKSDQEFNGTYYKCEADGDHLNVELNYMNLYFQSPENYNQFCEDIKIFKDIRINGQLSIYMKTLSLRMQRLENFGELGKTITFVKELDINNLILHDFEGMPEVKSFKANNSTIFTFNGFKYKDAVKDIELYYKPGQHCVIDWTGFPKKLYGIFSYKLNIDSDSLAAYTIAFERQLTTLSGFPDDFMYISDPENVMHVGQPNFVDINMEKWQRDKIKLHIMDLLLQSFPNKQKRDKLYKRLTKIYRYR